MDFIILKINSPEWNEMWDFVSAHPINQGIDEPSVALHENFVWEYRGTYKKNNELVSEFIHRNHPLTKTLASISFAHKLNSPDSIQKSFKL